MKGCCCFKIQAVLFTQTPPILPTPPSIFQILPPPLAPSPTSLSPPTLTSIILSVVIFLWLNGWSHHIWRAILLNDNMDIHMSSLVTLVPEGPSFVFYATRHHVYWGLTHNTVFYWYSNLISHTQICKHTQHTQGSVDWHTHVNIYLNHLLCVHSSCFYYYQWLNE